MELTENPTLNKINFRIRAQTLLLVEGTSVSNARNIYLTREDALRDKCGIELFHFMENFRMVTHGASVLARVANASVSLDIHVPDET